MMAICTKIASTGDGLIVVRRVIFHYEPLSFSVSCS